MSQKDLTGFGEINALLGRGTEYEGKLTFDGRVRIDGRFKGEIWSDDMLILGEGAEVDASIHVGTLIVRGGRLHGDVDARQLVEIHAPARVTGRIQTPQIFIDKGAVFEGRCHMGDGPTKIHALGEDEPAVPDWKENAPAFDGEMAPRDDEVREFEVLEDDSTELPQAASARGGGRSRRRRRPEPR